MLAHDQAGQYSSIEGGEAHNPPPIAEELLLVDGSWERESQFSLRVAPGGSNYALVDGPMEGFLLGH